MLLSILILKLETIFKLERLSFTPLLRQWTTSLGWIISYRFHYRSCWRSWSPYLCTAVLMQNLIISMFMIAASRQTSCFQTQNNAVLQNVRPGGSKGTLFALDLQYDWMKPSSVIKFSFFLRLNIEQKENMQRRISFVTYIVVTSPLNNIDLVLYCTYLRCGADKKLDRTPTSYQYLERHMELDDWNRTDFFLWIRAALKLARSNYAVLKFTFKVPSRKPNLC